MIVIENYYQFRSMTWERFNTSSQLTTWVRMEDAPSLHVTSIASVSSSSSLRKHSMLIISLSRNRNPLAMN